MIMEEENLEKRKKKQLPSFPSNYVTLVQLQERWLKEKQHKEQQEAPPQKFESASGSPGPGSRSHTGNEKREIPNSEIKIGHGDGDGADHVGEGGEEKKKKKSSKNRKKRKGKKLESKEEAPPLENSEKEEKSRGKSRASSVKGEEEVVVHAPLANSEKKEEEDVVSERRKQRSRGGFRGQIGARASSVNGEKLVERRVAVVETPLVNGEKKQVSDRRRNHSGKGIRGQTRAESNDLDHTKASSENSKNIYVRVEKGVTRKEALMKAPLKEDVPKTIGESRKDSNVLDQTADVEPEFRALSVNDGIVDNDDDADDEGLRRTSAYHKHCYRESKRHGSGRFSHQGLRNKKDGRMVWVKKEEVFDGNGCGAQKQGSSRAVSG